MWTSREISAELEERKPGVIRHFQDHFVGEYIIFESRSIAIAVVGTAEMVDDLCRPTPDRSPILFERDDDTYALTPCTHALRYVTPDMYRWFIYDVEMLLLERGVSNEELIQCSWAYQVGGRRGPQACGGRQMRQMRWYGGVPQG